MAVLQRTHVEAIVKRNPHAGYPKHGEWTREEVLKLRYLRDKCFKKWHHTEDLWDRIAWLMATRFGYIFTSDECSDRYHTEGWVAC